MRLILQLCLLVLMLLGAEKHAWGKVATSPQAAVRDWVQDSRLGGGIDAPPRQPTSWEAAAWDADMASAGDIHREDTLTMAGPVVVTSRGAAFLMCPGAPPPFIGSFRTTTPAWVAVGPNVYAYVQQNPWTAFDPDGLKALVYAHTPQEYKRLKKQEGKGLYHQAEIRKGYKVNKDGSTTKWRPSGTVFNNEESGLHLYDIGLAYKDASWVFDSAEHASIIQHHHEMFGLYSAMTGFSGLGRGMIGKLPAAPSTVLRPPVSKPPGNVAPASTAIDEAAQAETTIESYEIGEGVRRAKAADMLKKETIQAKIIREGQPDQLKDVPLTTLKSPKEAIDARSMTNAERMASVLEGTRKGTVPPIEVRPGTRGTPIQDVKINYPGSP